MVNLLGQSKEKGVRPKYTAPVKKRETEIYYHLPEKTVAEATVIEKPPEPKIPAAPRKSRLTLFIIIGIIIVGLGLFSLYYVYFFNRVIPITNVTNENTNNTNLNIVENTNTAENININVNENINTPPPVLPDTELAPIRGALVKFFGDDTVYLVENNGELRTVIQNNVTFKNGQKFSDISRSLIYTISDRWKTIRRGTTDVSGQVDFDPRVLTYQEIAPFIR